MWFQRSSVHTKLFDVYAGNLSLELKDAGVEELSTLPCPSSWKEPLRPDMWQGIYYIRPQKTIVWICEDKAWGTLETSRSWRFQNVGCPPRSSTDREWNLLKLRSILKWEKPEGQYVLISLSSDMKLQNLEFALTVFLLWSFIPHDDLIPPHWNGNTYSMPLSAGILQFGFLFHRVLQLRKLPSVSRNFGFGTIKYCWDW